MILPEEILLFAEGLLRRDECSEIDFRNAAARSYYACLHLVHDVLGTRATDVGMSHKAIEIELRRAWPAGSPAVIRSAQRHWRTLKEARWIADYDTAAAFPETKAQMVVKLARRIFDARRA